MFQVWKFLLSLDHPFFPFTSLYLLVFYRSVSQIKDIMGVYVISYSISKFSLLALVSFQNIVGLVKAVLDKNEHHIKNDCNSNPKVIPLTFKLFFFFIKEIYQPSDFTYFKIKLNFCKRVRTCPKRNIWNI